MKYTFSSPPPPLYRKMLILYWLNEIFLLFFQWIRLFWWNCSKLLLIVWGAVQECFFLTWLYGECLKYVWEKVHFLLCFIIIIIFYFFVFHVFYLFIACLSILCKKKKKKVCFQMSRLTEHSHLLRRFAENSLCHLVLILFSRISDSSISLHSQDFDDLDIDAIESDACKDSNLKDQEKKDADTISAFHTQVYDLSLFFFFSFFF